MASGEGPGPVCPTVEYKDYKKDPQNYVEIRVEIPGIKNQLIGGPNADISFKTEERSFNLNVKLKKGKEYEYGVKMLPEPISTGGKSTFKVGKNEVVILLHKVTPGLWSSHLSATGLETA